MNLLTYRKRKKWPWILLSIFVILFGGVFFVYSWIKNLTPEKLLQSNFVQQQIVNKFGEDNAQLVNLFPSLLGFDSPKTYLILFLNNTELRPGGGFIGSYATLHFDQGKTNILQMGGTENINVSSSALTPPKIMTEKLKVDRWFFRDSNWSPDFVESSKKTLEFYQAGDNIGAKDISGVIGITIDALEKLMKVTGPFVVEEIEFTADNVIEKLEYEVEYGYDDKGISFSERKDIMKTFMLALMNHLKDNFFKNIYIYQELALSLLNDKNIVIYSLSPNIQKIVDEHDWSGRMKENSGDYIMWVDANLGALKTDRVIKRNLNYNLSLDKDYYKAVASMVYTHTGSFDWRTTKYLTYARVYVPLDSKLISVQVGDQIWQKNNIKNNFEVDSGVENGKQWFGTYLSIEPGKQKTVNFTYSLPSNITKIIQNKNYSLLVQRQIGMNNVDLTMHLEFDTTRVVSSALPAENEVDWNDNIYNYSSDLKEDLEFDVKF
ncbi:MAG: hypothetical protein COY69_03275 [Candidatus Magasanikbacteria bacterium CG_4_10_14_0_8_um_filter_32_14]|uniref:DUF4012 domain-containing protein n=2 Tax=Candidatus Magasanikiibacteriota TaxID=1752731 RepID=A0A2M7R8Q7_9BACT|nr:MAG: hypothetical protein AUJ23_00680 [Candidatus Magasanikbacteria bacterium CG1_02_32_51]PIY93130.1 MAG: hypothetical protein COY69_03275 [Candidatus Magasanikbacteria bacterium CG_4_10_14_0_8_um_filter_32_14]